MIYVHLYLWMNNIVHLLCGSNTWHGSALKPGCTGLRSSTWWITQWKPWEACPNLDGAQSKLAKYQMAINGRCLYFVCVCWCYHLTIKRSTNSRVSSSPYGGHGISNHHTNPELRQFMPMQLQIRKASRFGRLARRHCYGMLWRQQFL